MNEIIRFAIIDPVPDIRSPEKEIISNIKRSLVNCQDIFFYVFSNEGSIIYGSNDSDKVSNIREIENDLDFVIILDPHSFCVAIDIFQYLPLWMPVGFPSKFVYKNYSSNINSCDDFLDTYGVGVDVYIGNLLKNTGHLESGCLSFTSTTSKDFLEPKLHTNPKIFYAGINVERRGTQFKKRVVPGRFHDLFKKLDAKDCVEFYGPDEFDGYKVWEGFNSYKGFLPFDLMSLGKKINECGVVLAFHYKLHEYRGTPTTRILEACMAGAIVIADDMPFMRKNFGDSIFVIDTTKDVTTIEKEIDAIFQWVKENPKEAQKKAKKSQKIFLEKFATNNSIIDVCKGHKKRQKEVYNHLHKICKDKIIDVLVLYKGNNEQDIKFFVKQITNQAYPNINAIFVCSEDIGYIIETKFSSLLVNQGISFKLIKTNINKWPVRTKTTGELLSEAISHMRGDYFCVLDVNQSINKNHLSSLINRIHQRNDTMVAYSGVCYRYNDKMVIINNESITTDEILSFYGYYSNKIKESLFNNFETKLLKSSVLISKNILQYCNENEFSFIEGCEHLFFLSKAIGYGGESSYTYSHKITTSLHLNYNSDKNILAANPVPILNFNHDSKLYFNIDKILYPYKLTFKDRHKTFQSTAAQMLDCFMTDINLEPYFNKSSNVNLEPYFHACYDNIILQKQEFFHNDDLQTIKYLTKLLLPSMRFYSTVKRKLRSLFSHTAA